MWPNDVVCNCARDEGGPLGLGLQGQGPNRLKLLWSNGQGGERSRKRRDQTRQVRTGKANASEPLMRCRKLQTSSKPSFNVWFGISPGGNLCTARAVTGIKAARDQFRLLCGTWEPSSRC